jgi:dienelactone hydrolase
MKHGKIIIARLATFLLTAVILSATAALAAVPPALPTDKQPDDVRLGNLRTTESDFPMQPVADIRDWTSRREEIRTRVLVAAGLHPLPVRSPLNAILHGKVERDDYTVERVIFESFAGHFVTGSLYRPKTPAKDRHAAVLSPYGHWRNGRFGFSGIEDGNKIQARCVQLARMGCVAFVYDMEGFCDSMQISHASGPRPSDPGQPGYLLISPQAELQGQTILGLQTWNSVRALDFICSLPDVDPKRIGITGASSGATQTLMITAIDERIVASFPVCMVSAAVSQGGCPCESAPYLRINQGNVDIAAATAPRPLGICSANDHTQFFETNGDAEVRRLYALLGRSENYEAHFRLEFPHNYNAANRHYMYDFMNQHLRLGLPGPIKERDFPPLSEREASVWTTEHPKPVGDSVGDRHERKLTAEWAQATQAAFDQMSQAERRRMIAAGVTTMVGRMPNAVEPVKWNRANQVSVGNCLVTAGTLTVTKHSEQLPAVFIYPKRNWNRQVLVWLTDSGKNALFAENGKPLAAIAALVDKGYGIASLDMLGQGEFVGPSSGSAIKSVRMVPPRGRAPGAACHTFGYNPPLVVNRVHDVMSLVEFLRCEAGERKADHINLVAIGRQAGPVGLIARFMLGDQIQQAAIDPQGFDFNTVDRLDNPIFVPGILRYGGMDALWLLNQPMATAKVKGAGDAARIFVTARSH